jgi:hypothetical protein
MSDLTIPSWITLAQRLADSENRKLRRKFKQFMYFDDEINKGVGLLT